jgi:magnesium transporter
MNDHTNRIDTTWLADRESAQAAALAISGCLERSDATALRLLLEELETADIATVLELLAPDEAAAVLALIPDVSERGRVFGYLPAGRQVAIAESLERTDLAEMVAAMPHDERADLFKRLTDEQQSLLLPGLALAEREDVRTLAAYPEGTIGSVMTSDYATLNATQTAAAALEALRLQAPSSETIYQAYVVGHERHLLGTVSLRDVLLADPGAAIADIMDADPIFLRAQDPRADAARLISRYDLIALPVLDAKDRLVGIITYDDAMDVAEEEATEDFLRSGSVGSFAETVRNAPILQLYRSRIAWLVLLVFGNIFSGLGIAAFESTIEAYVALVFFLPLLIASGGNAGAQSATLMVRALAMGDVRAGDWLAVLSREFLVAALLGGSMALAVSLIGLARGGPEIAAVVALSMIAIVMVGSLIGISLPFLLNRFRMDPAIASAPLVTSIADATGVLIYFNVATAILAMPA